MGIGAGSSQEGEGTDYMYRRVYYLSLRQVGRRPEDTAALDRQFNPQSVLPGVDTWKWVAHFIEDILKLKRSILVSHNYYITSPTF